MTAPGGRVLASTHGVQVYHPSPVDYWRWTHEGLRRLFEQNANWASLQVEPAAGTASALAMLLGTYVEIALRRTVARAWARLGAEPRRLGARRPQQRASPARARVADPEFHVIADV